MPSREVIPGYFLRCYTLTLDGLRATAGELVLYHPVSDEIMEIVTPDFGKMVIFLSEEFPHEVLPAQTKRYSLTGWFRKKQLTCAVY